MPDVDAAHQSACSLFVPARRPILHLRSASRDGHDSVDEAFHDVVFACATFSPEE
jgi:hypothetical protein